MGRIKEWIANVYTRIKLHLTFCLWGGMILTIPSKIKEEYLMHSCSPEIDQIFRAFKLCPFNCSNIYLFEPAFFIAYIKHGTD